MPDALVPPDALTPGQPGPAAPDPFGTTGLRERVLAAWAASPARFREDANAEEDYALGGYRDRVVVELAQNAADAATRAGVPGRLRLSLRDGVLTAANTGTPLDAAGVEGLSTLRASAKRDEPAAGRFGVGFAAVVAISDEPRIASRTGAVGWSRARSRELAAALPALAGELAVRGGNVPVLRLPFPAAPEEGSIGAGYDTAVIVPLRDEAAIALAARLLAEAGPALLLALPALDEVTIEAGGTVRTLAATRAGTLVAITDQSRSVPLHESTPSPAPPALVTTWQVSADGGPVGPALLADRPVEERARPSWSVRWAIPLAGDPAPGASAAGDGGGTPARLPTDVPAVVHAPTPSDEPLGLPALLLASFPLTPDRRHVAPGPLTDFLVERAADAYAALLPRLGPGPSDGTPDARRAAAGGLLNLVPGPVANGELDVRLRQAILDRLPGVAFLPRAAAAQPGGSSPAIAQPATLGASAGGAAGFPDAGLDGLSLAGWPGGEPGAGTGWSGPGAGEKAGPDAGDGRVRPGDALLLDMAAPPALGPYLADLLPDLIAGPSRHPAYATLGIRRLPLAEVADLAGTLERPAPWWRGLYAALADVDPGALAELGALPVPLADGRLIRGPRGVLLPGPGLGDPARLAPLRLRVADPAAAHPLLARLGALEATPRSLLEHPATVAAVDASLDEEDPGPIAEAVLGLVAAAQVQPGELGWLADLALPTADGDWDPAGDLLLPGGELAQVVAPDADFGEVDPELADRYGPGVLAAAGVLSSFGLLHASDVDFGDAAASAMELDLDDEPAGAADLDLDGAEDWARAVRERCGWTGDDPVPPLAAEVTAVRDLDLVDPARWPRALEIITARPRLRAALLRPVTVRLADGTHRDVPSYTAWWLGTHPVLAGRRPADLHAATADPVLAGLYDDAAQVAAGDPGLARLLADRDVARALGVRDSLDALVAEPDGADELLARLADPGRPVTRRQLRSLWIALAAAGADATPPDQVRAILGNEVVVADAADALVLDAPDLWPLVAGRPLVLAPYDLALVLAEVLDVPVASEEVPGEVDGPGERRPVPPLVLAAFPDAPPAYLAHDELLVDGVPVPWRCAEGAVHVASPGGQPVPQALASGLAWASGQWSARHLLATLLTSPDDSPRLQAEADLDAAG